MNKVLAITGATGKKSGGYFTQVLSEHADQISSMFPGGIRATIRASSDTSLLDKSSIHFQKCMGILEDSNFLKTVFSGVDTIVHIAGIQLSMTIVETAISCGVRRLILVHTTGIYSKYKQAGEGYRKIEDYIYKACKDAGIILTILRPTMIYGNLHDNNVVQFIQMVDKFPLMPVVNGARYDLQPVHYSDLSKAYYQVLMHEETTANKDFILSGGSPITLRDMLTTIGKQLGKRVRFVSCPYPIAYVGAIVLYGVSLTKIDYREKVQRLCEPRVFSYQEAKEAFGYSPIVFEEGITNEIKDYKRG
ncbi:NAD-dependent epimerase/dehydratase family protein [Scatolibacter rhodanostii]|uniref:NAD-dependent epimerase/dehydratase family protein n=1 Tax=Scatolibacter rhodanostii TaxID=2014781 RepID=UPI000C06A00E|nr:NmrA family NAD(P)-binding protein [Scatolibacter rhodanostii]